MARKRNRQKSRNWMGVIVLIVIFVTLGYFGWNSSVVRARIQNSFGNTAKVQKAEYKKQQSIAQRKYGVESVAAVSQSTNKAADKQSSAKTSTVSSSNVSKKSSSGQNNYQTYVVQVGDTLSAIAAKYQTTTTKLMDLNNLESGTISSGTALKVPVTSTAVSSSQNSSN